MMAGSPANVFALYDGFLGQANATDRVDLTISPSQGQFTLPNHQMVLGFETVAGPDGQLNPAAVQVYNANNVQVATLATRTDIGGLGESLTLVNLAANTPYHLVVSGRNGTSGAYQIRTFLAGDLNGDGTVDTDNDLRPIANLLRSGPYQAEADANLDGAISAFDYTQARTNLGDKTTLTPLTLTELVSGGTTVTGLGLVTGQATTTVSGVTAPNTPLLLDAGDGLFGAGSTVSDSQGRYAFQNIALAEGSNTLEVRARTTGDFTQQRLATATIRRDSQAPTLTIQSPTTATITKANLTIQGTVGDTIVGLASGSGALSAQVDGGVATPVAFDPVTGQFQFTTALPLDGTAEGSHTVTFTATNGVGTTSTANVTFTLDTLVPQLTLSSPTASAHLVSGDLLVGQVDGTGSPVTVTYQFDAGAAIPLTVSNGTFSQAFDLSGLTDGGHILNVTATDQAGNSSTQTISITTGAVSTFTVTKFTPTANAAEIGVTVKPEIFFSQPVDPDTVNSDDFYATFAGVKLDTKIVVSNDGTYAWLFFQPSMPDASQIRITVDGSKIRASGGTTPLDAMADGMAGSVLTYDFQTVSSVPVANTSLSGYVVDPGPDLQPMTADDYDPATGKYLLPIEGVKVYIVGLEDQAVYTDANGYYHLPSVPIGNVKVAVDGLTATNPPPGYYFPVMVMDATMKPGIDNDLMQSMTSGDMSNMMAMLESLGHAAGEAGMSMDDMVGMGPMPMYQPRVQTAILHTVTQAGMKIVADDHGAPGLTPEQQAMLTVNVAPNSLIGPDGSPIASAQIGISVVPPETVMDMLPPGVLQHTFDITVQAMGATNFSTPAAMTFPNVYNDPSQPDYAAPNSKLYFLSFDHNTGRLVIEGTATVSADGKTVSTDPGVGVTHPGWHGLVPPGDMTKGPGPQPPPCVSTQQAIDDVVDLGTAVAKCLANLSGVSAWVKNALKLADDLRKLTNNAVSLYNQIQANPNDFKTFLAAFATFNSLKNGVVDAVNIATSFSPATKIANAAKCANDVLSALSSICNRLTAQNSPCNTVTVRVLCIGLSAAQGVLDKINKLSELVENGLGRLGLALVCTTSNQIQKLLSASGGGTPSHDSAGPQLFTAFALNDSPAADPSDGGDDPVPPDYDPVQIAALLQEMIGQINEQVDNADPIQQFAETFNDAQTSVMQIQGNTTQLKFETLGASDGYYSFQYNDASGNPITLRGRADDNGQVDVVLPPSTDFTFEIYDFRTQMYATYTGTTGPSGEAYQIPNVTFSSTKAVYDFLGNLISPALVDSTGDGLPDLIKDIVGVDPTSTDPLDKVQVDEGLDPTSAPPPIGIIGTIQPQTVGSDVQDVVASDTTAYLAAGSGGIQVVDISKINQPAVIASVPASQLGGNALAVSFTSIPDTDPDALPGTFKDLVAAAMGGNGLAVVDVTDPPAAHLVTTVPIPGGALSVQIVDNLAYVGGHGGLLSIVDMVTDQVVTTFKAAGGGDVTAVKFSGSTLYTLSNGTLAAYDISANLALPTLLSSISYPGATHLFVGTNRAYLSGNLLLAAVDITDPTNLQNSSGTFQRLNYGSLAVNGSGALVVGTAATFNGIYLASLFDVSNPDDVNDFVTQFNTEGSVEGVWIQNGLALIADGTGGFAIFNYQNLVNKHTPPTVVVTTTSPDGATIAEGSRLRIDVDTTTVSGDQTRTVTLTANGVTYQPDGSYPFSFFVDVPALSSGEDTEALVITASDTSGNTTTQTINLTIVQDTTPPKLLSVLPTKGGFEFNALQSFRATFDEPLDPMTLTTGSDLATGSIHILKAGPDGLFTDATLVPIGSIDFRLSIDLLTVLPTTPLGPGKYELVLDTTQITDRAGNPLGTDPALVATFATVQGVPFDSLISGSINNPGQIDLYSFQAPAGSEVTLFANWYPDYTALGSGHIALIGPDGATILASADGSGSSELSNVALPTAGLYTVEILASSGNPLAIGDYQFTISDPNPQVQTIAYGQSITSQIAVRGDNPPFEFSGTAGDLVDLAYSGPAVSSILVYNPDGTLAATLPGGTTSVLYALPITQTGTYRFVIRDNDATGSYTVRLDQGSFTKLVAGKFDTVQTGTIDPAYAIDEYSYVLKAGDVTTIFADLSSMGGGTVHLLDAATGKDLVAAMTGTQLEFSRYVSDSNRTILVEVTGANGHGFTTGTFTLTASNPTQPTQTLPLGGEKTATILVRGDDQPWQFTTTSANEVATFAYRGPNLANGIVITRPDGSTLVTLPAGSTILGRDLVLDQVGTYHFTLADPTATGSYTLDLSSPAIAQKTPTPLTINKATASTISPVLDVDVYSVVPKAGAPFTVLAEWAPGGHGVADGEIDVYAPDGTLVATTSGTTDSSLTIASAVAGTYLVKVRAASGDDFQTGAYRLTAFQNAKVLDDTLATAQTTGIQAGTTHFQVNGFLGNSTDGVKDVDLYAIQATRGDQIAVTVNATSGSDLAPYLRLFDSSGNQVATPISFGTSAGTYLAYTALTDGTYYVGVSSTQNTGYNPTVSGSGSGGSVGGYAITVDTSRDYTGPHILAVSPTGSSSRDDISSFVIGFNKRLLAATANDADNYSLVSAGADGVFGTGDDQTLTATPTYNDANHTVTLTLDQPLPVGFAYQLTIKGTGATPITDIAGNPLDDGADEVRYLQLNSNATAGTTPASFPFSDGFETGSFGPEWTVDPSGEATVTVVAQNAHNGSYSAQFSDTGEAGRATLILSIDLSGLTASSEADLSFWHQGYGNGSMPASFSGRVNADGVAISEDGVNWYRVVDLGNVYDSSYTHYVADLKGALLAAGLPFPTSTPLQVMFQQYEYNGQTDSIDDVQVDTDLAGPTITAVSTPGPLVFNSNLTTITIDFSKTLQSLGANAVSSYELTRNGSPVTVTPHYNSATNEVTLTSASPLPAGTYTLTINGNPAVNGTSQIRDIHGNLLNNGKNSTYTFTVIGTEATDNDEIDQATATGLVSGGSQYSITTAIGNNANGTRDVDLFKFTAKAGDRLSAAISSQFTFGAASLDTLLRLFDASGKQIASNDNAYVGTTDSSIANYEILANGTYYLGVSSQRNGSYNPNFAPSGVVGGIGEYSLTIGLTPEITAPTVVKVLPHAGPNVGQAIQTVQITFSDLVPTNLATDPSNYSLTYLGADGTLGTADDQVIAFTPTYNAKTGQVTLSLTGPNSLLPLPVGSYELRVRGTAGHITDLAGNLLGGGNDYVEDFNVIAPESPLNDRVADATNSGINDVGGQYTVQAAIGDNAFGPLDVDLYKVVVPDGLRLTASIRDVSIGSPLSGRLRLFDSAGNQLAVAENGSADTAISFDVPAAGTYYVGVSGSGNAYYNPFSPGSGSTPSTTGEYILTITTSDVTAPVATGISAPQVSTDPNLSQVSIQFSKALDLASAGSVASYSLIESGPDRIFGTTDDVSLPFTVNYNVSTHQATLTTASPIPTGDVEVIVHGSALTDRYGLALNGGKDQTFQFSQAAAGAPLPFLDGFETGKFGTNWISLQADHYAISQVTTVGGPRRGSYDLELASSTYYYNRPDHAVTTATAILVVQPNNASALQLSFYEKRAPGDSNFTLPTTFTGNASGSGVAISVDGTHWYRVVDLSTQNDTGVYDHFTADLAAAATANNLSLNGVLLIRFSTSDYYAFDGTNNARFFDDIRVSAGPTAPTLTGLVAGNFVVGSPVQTIGLTFSAPLDPTAAGKASNYQLFAAGPDGVLGTADDVSVSLSDASYDGQQTVTLTAASALADGSYRVVVTTGVTDPNGVPLNEGLAQSLNFDASSTEVSTNDTIATATDTGLTAGVDGSFSLTTAIGNNDQAGKDVDIYAVSGVSGERLAVHVSRAGISGLNLLVSLFDASGSLIGSGSTTTASNGQATVAILLDATATYYVAISASGNASFDPNTAGSGSDGGSGLYSLTINADSGIAVPPLSEGFEETTGLPLGFTSYDSTGTGTLVQLSKYEAHSGSQSLLLGTALYNSSLTEATLTFDATALDRNELSFFAYDLPYYGFYALNPTGGSFTGHFNGDGVSISVDGTTFYPIIDFAAANQAGKFSYNTWTKFEFDLQAFAASKGLTLNDHTEIRFQHYSPYNYYSNIGLYLDDLRIDQNLTPPKVLSATGDHKFVISNSLNALTVTFDESLDANAATNASDFLLQRQGPSGSFDASDATNYSLTPTYDDSTHTVSLAINGLVGALPTGIYRLRLIGTGSTPLKDPYGNILGDGTNQDIVFAITPPESPTNDTLATATSTGVNAAGGIYTTSAALGDDSATALPTTNDLDLYQFSANAGQFLYVHAQAGYNAPHLLLRLFDATGNPVTSYVASGINDAILDHFVIPATGTYYLGVSGSDDSSYNPVDGSGTSGVTQGLYKFSLQVINPAAFPLSDGFESGTINPAYWDVYTTNGGTVAVTKASPLDGTASLAFSGSVYQTTQRDLTLHVDLSGVSSTTPVELRFLEQNVYDYSYYGQTYPQSYGQGRYNGASGLFLSVDGSNFYRVDPTLFNQAPGSPTQRSVNLSEFAALNGLALGADTEIRFSNYGYNYNTTSSRLLDDVQVVVDTFGPKVTTVVTDSNSASFQVLNDALTTFTATFDARLDPNLANNANAYELIFAGPDGKLPGESGDANDDTVIPLRAAYDGNFKVSLAIDPAHLRLTPGRYELVFKGTGPNALADPYGNVLNGGPGSANAADRTFVYNVVASGPRVVASTPPQTYYYSRPNYSSATGFSTVSLTFNEPILASSFTGQSVQITDQSGAILVDPSQITVAPTSGDITGTLWTITFPAVHTPGTITVTVGPNITDLSGVAMNQNDNFTNGENPGDTYSVSATVSDNTGYDNYHFNLTDQDNHLFDINLYNGQINTGGLVDSNGSPTGSSSYSGMDVLSVGGSDYSNSSFDYTDYNYAFALSDSGRNLILPAAPIAGLQVHREIYVPATGGDFVRYLDVLVNPSNAPISTTVTLRGSLASGSLTVISSSSDGSSTLNPADTYLTTSGGGRLSLGHVFMDGKGGAILSSASIDSYGNLTWTIPVTVPAGQTIRVLTFETQQADDGTAQSVAAGLVGLPTSALAGLTDAEKGSIVNFAVGDTVSPVLASITPDPSTTLLDPVYQFVATFSERLDPVTANNASNYTLVSAGADGLLGTDDDSFIALTPVYDDTDDTVTLTVDPNSSPLPGGLYQLTLAAALTDLAGNSLNGGSDTVETYIVFGSGPQVDDFTPDDTTAETGWSSVTITFNEAILASSFTADQVSILGPNGQSAIDSSQLTIAPVDGDTTGTLWTISFPTIHNPGAYQVRLGPGIENTIGEAMNQDGDLVNGEDPDDDFLATVNISDTEGTNLSTADGQRYDISTYYGTISQGGSSASSAAAPYNNFGYLSVGGSTYTNPSYSNNAEAYDYALRDGGQTLVLPTYSLSGLDVHRELYVPSSGDFARFLDVFSNPYSTPITTSISFSGSLAAGATSIIATSSDGSGNFNPADTYVVTSDSQNAYLAVGHVFMDGTALKLADANFTNGAMAWSYIVTIGPGQTVRLMTLESQQETEAAAQDAAQALSTLSTPGVLDNLTDDEKGSILNFTTGFDTLAPFVTNNLSQPRFDNYGPVVSLNVNTSKPLDPDSASNPANYTLVGAGPDGVFGTGDDASYALNPSYAELDFTNPSSGYVSLLVGDGSEGLPEGLYQLALSGSILGANGLGLNSGNGVIAQFQVLHDGPVVQSFTPDSTNPETGWSSFHVTFSSEIDPSSFTADQVLITSSDNSTSVDPATITISGSGTDWTVAFPTITGPGSYRVQIGPDIRDTSGALMNQNGNATLGEDPDDAYVTYVDLTDTSGSSLVDGGNFQYTVSPYNGGLAGGGYLDPSTGNLIHTGSYSYYPAIGFYAGDQFYYYSNNGGDYAVTNSGRQITLPTLALGNLLVSRQYNVTPTGQYLRILDTLTNPGTTAVTVTLYEYGSLGSSQTQFLGDSSHSSSVSTSDTWFLTGPTSGSDGLVLGHILDDGKALKPSSVYQSSQYAQYSFTFTIQPGQTVRILTLETQQLDTTSATTQASALASLPEDAIADLADEVRATIINFAVPTSTPAAPTNSPSAQVIDQALAELATPANNTVVNQSRRVPTSLDPASVDLLLSQG